MANQYLDKIAEVVTERGSAEGTVFTLDKVALDMEHIKRMAGSLGLKLPKTTHVKRPGDKYISALSGTLPKAKYEKRPGDDIIAQLSKSMKENG